MWLPGFFLARTFAMPLPWLLGFLLARTLAMPLPWLPGFLPLGSQPCNPLSLGRKPKARVATLMEEEWWLWIIRLNDTTIWKAVVNWDSRWSHWSMLLWNQVCEVCTFSLVNVIIICCLVSKLLMQVLNLFYFHKFTFLKIQWKKMLAF
jgi:hypothetical protein